MVLKHNKGMVYVTLISLVLGAILLFAVFKVGAQGLGIFTSSEKAAFKDTVDILNAKSPYDGGMPILFKKNSPIVGFSKDKDKFFCPLCYEEVVDYSTSERSYYSTYMKKPIANQCTDSACVCLCSDISHKIVKIGETEEFELFCESLSCQPLKNNIPSKITPANKSGQVTGWEGGFLVGYLSMAYNGIPQPETPKAETWIKRQQTGEGFMVAACPDPCVFPT